MKKKNQSAKLTVLLIYCVVLISLSSQLFAQSERARIIGTVSDQGGAIVPSATVSVTNVATGIVTKTATDSQGQYQAAELPIGAYKVKVEHVGFNTAETVAYTLEINQVLRIDVKLKVGATTEVVEVTGEVAQVETVNPTLGASVTAAPIVNLPLNGRNVLDLATLQPGVTPNNPDDGGAGTFNIAGGRADSVTFLLDGGVDNNLLSNGVVYTPNPDAIQEFRILTSNYTAEYGRNAGGVISLVTKSGGNTIHGSVFEFNRNDTFAANKYFNNRNGVPKEDLNRNQYGVTVGGPFIKNKLFWFGSYQGQKLTQGITSPPINTFTPEMLQGNFSHAGPSGGVDPDVASFLLANPAYQADPVKAANGIIDPNKIDPVMKKYIAAGLIPTSPSGTLLAQGDRTIDFNEFTGKLDFNPTEKDHFTATLGGRRQPEVRPFQSLNPTASVAPGFPGSYVTHSYFSHLNYVRTFTPNVLNEFRLTMQRNANSQAVPAASAAIPSVLGIAVTPDQATGPTRLGFESNLLIGFSPQGPTTLIDNTFAYSDTLSWTKGTHNLKFGGSFVPYENNTVFDFFVNGQFDFDNFNGTLNQYANALLGMPEDYFQFGSAPSNIRQKSSFVFAQDEWHALSNLTLTLGIRYEYSSPKLDTQGRSFSLVPGAHSSRFVNAPTSLLFPGDQGAPKGANFPDKNDWAPRVGFAWDPFKNGRTSVRGGVGMFYDVLKGEDNLQFNGQAPFFGFTNPVFDDCSAGGCTAPTGFMTNPFLSTGTVNPFPSKPPAPNIDFAAAGFLPFGGGGVFFVNPNLRTPYTWQYNLAVQRELLGNLALEVGYVGSQSRKLTTLIDSSPFDRAQAHRVLNEIGGINDLRFSYLLGFENAVNANYNGLESRLSKKTSNTRYLGTTYFTLAYTWAHTIDNSSGFRNRTSQIPFYQRNAFRASSDFDVRHRISFSGGWDLPFDQAWESGPKRLTKGWSLYPIVSWRTGFPLDVLAQLSSRRTQPGPSGAGDAGIVYALRTGPITYFDPSHAVAGPGNPYFDGSVFTTTGLTGCNCYGSGRNILRGPGRTNFDLAVAKKTSITERTAIEFRAEFFNIFNHAEFNNPDTNIGDKPIVGSATPGTFGLVTGTADPRIVQFAARFTF